MGLLDWYVTRGPPRCSVCARELQDLHGTVGPCEGLLRRDGERLPIDEFWDEPGREGRDGPRRRLCQAMRHLDIGNARACFDVGDRALILWERFADDRYRVGTDP